MLTYETLDPQVKNDCKNYGCISNVKKILLLDLNDIVKGRMICDEIIRKRKIEKEYRENNKQKISKKKKEYREKNKQKISEYNKKYYENNKEKVLKDMKQYHEKNKEQILKNNKKYREKNKKRISEYRKEYRENNKQKISEDNKKYYENNKQQISEFRKQQYEKDILECRNYLGNECFILRNKAPTDQVDFHHISQIDKDFKITDNTYFIRTNNSRMIEELKKCGLMHPLIHQLIHEELNEIKRRFGLNSRNHLPSELYHKHWELFTKRYRNHNLDEIEELCDTTLEQKYPELIEEFNIPPQEEFD